MSDINNTSESNSNESGVSDKARRRLISVWTWVGAILLFAVAIYVSGILIIPIGIIVCRVTAIFHQYTNKVGQAVLIFLCAIGLIPLALAAVLSPVSLEALVLGIALGPVVTVGFMWICPFSWNRNKPIDLRRTTVVFREERP